MKSKQLSGSPPKHGVPGRQYNASAFPVENWEIGIAPFRGRHGICAHRRFERIEGDSKLLLAAKKANLIPEVLPEIQALQRVGFYASEALVRRILSEAKEA